MYLDRDMVLEHGHVAEFAKIIGKGLPITVERIGTYPYGQCYGNVASQCAKSGGKAQYGWALLEVPSVYSYAWHHCVWQPNGSDILLDISKGPGDVTNGIVAFIPDNTIRPSPSDAGPDPHLIAQSADPKVDDIFKNLLAVMALTRRQTELNKSHFNPGRLIAELGCEIGILNSKRANLVADVLADRATK